MNTTNKITFAVRTVLCRRAVVLLDGVPTGAGAALPYLENVKVEARRYRDAGRNVRLVWVDSSYSQDLDDPELLADLDGSTEVELVSHETVREVWTGIGYSSTCDYETV